MVGTRFVDRRDSRVRVSVGGQEHALHGNVSGDGSLQKFHARRFRTPNEEFSNDVLLHFKVESAKLLITRHSASVTH